MCNSLLYLVALTHNPPNPQTTQPASGLSVRGLTATSRMCTSCPSWWLTAGPPPSAPQAPWPFTSAAVTQVRAAAGVAPLLTLSSLSPSASAAAALKRSSTCHCFWPANSSYQFISVANRHNTRQQISGNIAVSSVTSAGLKRYNVCIIKTLFFFFSLDKTTFNPCPLTRLITGVESVQLMLIFLFQHRGSHPVLQRHSLCNECSSEPRGAYSTTGLHAHPHR